MRPKRALLDPVVRSACAPSACPAYSRLSGASNTECTSIGIVGGRTVHERTGIVLHKRKPLFAFAYHPKELWLDEVARVAKDEPWGSGNKVLELYLHCNFEIAKAQNKVYENKKDGIAFWRAGHLANLTADPLWLVYEPNHKDEPAWKLRAVQAGDIPVPAEEPARYKIDYDPPEFDRSWSIYYEQQSLDHILRESRNRARLQKVFCRVFTNGEINDHVVFRTVFAEIELKRREEVVLPQWYHGDYQFLMPLFLTQGEKVELTAALRPEPTLRRYSIRTLLLPAYAYAYARAIVKSRANFADWMLLGADELKVAPEEEDEDDA